MIRRRAASGGFTLIELLVAMGITISLGLALVMAYSLSMQAYYRTEKNLQALAAYRSAADRLEREVNSIVTKAGVYQHPDYYWTDPGNTPWWLLGEWTTRVKYLNGEPYPGSHHDSDGYAVNSDYHTNPAKHPTHDTNWAVSPLAKSLYRINFRPRYLGYFSTLDGYSVDRSEWYFNPSEDRREWADGIDNDYDDPVTYGATKLEDGSPNPLYLAEFEAYVGGPNTLVDDRGCLMMRKVLDRDLVWKEWDENNPRATPPHYPLTTIRNDYRAFYHGPYSGCDFPPAMDTDANGEPDELERPLTNADLADSDKDGTVSMAEIRAAAQQGYIVDRDSIVVGEGFTDLRFHYLYKLNVNDRFIKAAWWPWDSDNNPANLNGKDSLIPTKRITAMNEGHQTGVEYGPAEGGANAYSYDGLKVEVGADRDGDGIADGLDACYFTLPLAISVEFTIQVGKQTHVYEKLIYLHGSQWLPYLNAER